jgi:lipopolysaccharide biosynthesis regulator YciM
MNWLTRIFGGNVRGPRNVDSAVRSALLAVLDRDFDVAEEQLAKAVRADADGVESYIALARLYRLRGEIGRAIQVHQNLLLRDDLDSKQRLVALMDLGADYRQGGFLQRAIATYEDVIAQEKYHLEALRALAPLLSGAHDYSRAIELSRRLAKLEGRERGPAEARLYVEMAQAAYTEGNHDQARRSIKKALRRDQGCVDAWVLLGDLEAERGRSKAALAAWSEVPRRDLRSGPCVYDRLESAYAAVDRAREFETYLRQLLEEHSDDVGARRALGGLLVRRGDIESAIIELRRLQGPEIDDLGARAALGRILLTHDRQEEAVQEYGALIDALEKRGLLDVREKVE